MSERERLLAKADVFAAEKEHERELAKAAASSRERHTHWCAAEIAYFGEKSARTFAEMEKQ